MRSAPDERRIVTVLFADLVGFTGLSESLDPEQVKGLVDAAFQRLVGDVVAFGGRVDKIIGDAIVALFGAPVAHEDDPERAVRAAMRMQETLRAFADEHAESLRMRVGVNTGEVLVGALRAGGDYTAMGDVVNTASRLQAAADPGSILVGELTFRSTEEVIAYQSRGALYLRGREAPVNVWEPTGTLVAPGTRPWLMRAPLIGRDREVALIHAAARHSMDRRRGQLILLLGEAGVGKSRLALEICEQLQEERSVRVFSGRCVPYGEANLWWPLAETLREGCGIELDDPVEVIREKVTRTCESIVDPTVDGGYVPDVVAGLLHILGVDGSLSGLEPSRVRAEATESLIVFLKASVRMGPIVVRLADLQWADESILGMVDELSERLSPLPLVVIGTARRSLLRRWTPKMGRFNAQILNVEPLAGSDAEALLSEITFGRALPSGLAEKVLERSGGNPLFLAELVHYIEKQSLESAETVDLPDSLRGLVGSRIDALSPEQTEVIEDASVWGPLGSFRVLQNLAASRASADEVAGVIRSLADAEIFFVESTGGREEWSFRSDVLREVAYERLTKGDRLDRHRRIGEFLESALSGRFADDAVVDMLARHFGEASELARSLSVVALRDGLDEKAVHWLAEAAHRAELAANWSQAIRLYTRMIEVAEFHPAEPTYRQLDFESRLSRSRAYMEEWDLDGALEELAVTRRVAKTLGDTALAWVQVVKAEVDRRRGNFDTARRSAESARRDFEAADELAEEPRHLGSSACWP